MVAVGSLLATEKTRKIRGGMMMSHDEDRFSVGYGVEEANTKGRTSRFIVPRLKLPSHSPFHFRNNNEATVRLGRIYLVLSWADRPPMT